MRISRIALCDMTGASNGAEVCAVVLCETEAGQVSLAVRAPATDDPTEALPAALSCASAAARLKRCRPVQSQHGTARTMMWILKSLAA
ncbi:hypothetical protein [Roseovarius tolerans]|uniref:hypothetical protein n=1 Tax=Roseovarius tolerans TaxID=74031 RepID=UPI00094385F5|nr:hypothetical protein [Roseovarius tolerans]